MPTCKNCGSFVTRQYCRVFVPDDGNPECCPDCTDLIRGANGRPRKRGWRASGVQ